MSEPSRDRDPFEGVAESFLARFRAGERPSIAEYAARHPELADQIRKLLPALVMVEQDLSVDVEPAPYTRDEIEGRSRRLGDYRILGEIGRGGMGVVYEAEQVSLGRRVALKILTGYLAGDGTGLERFRREARAAARLHHTNIVPVFEVGQDGEVAYYAMQLIRGQGLDQIVQELLRLREAVREANGHDPARSKALEEAVTLARPFVDAPPSNPQELALIQTTGMLLTGRLAGESEVSGLAGNEQFDPAATSDQRPDTPRREARPVSTAPSPSPSAVLPGGKHVSEVDTSVRRQPFFRSVAQIGRQAAQGLAYAHARGIIHRDIKPSNLLLDTDGVVWITDFGLAKAEDDGLTATGDILGTLRYMAPERFRGGGDARADLYALGLTLYELLTLRPAFDGSNRLNLIDQIKNEEPARPRAIDNHIPRDLETIVLKAIDKEPERRYVTADAIAEDLRRFLADEPIKARQIRASERFWRWAKRNPVIATMGGVLTALLVAVTIGSLTAAAHFRDSAERESFLAAREKLANDQSERDRKVAVKSQQEALIERDKSRQLSAGLTLDKGISLAEEGHADRGLLWMLEALKTAPDEAEAFRKSVRWNLDAWLSQVHKPLRIIDTGGTYGHLGFSPDGKSIATSTDEARPDLPPSRHIELWDSASGRKLGSLPDVTHPFLFRPDGKVLIANGDKGRVVAIDLATRQVLWVSSELPVSFKFGLRFNPDASEILTESGSGSTNDALLLRLDAATGQQRGAPLRLKGVATISPDSETVAHARIDGGEVYIDLLDLSSGRRKASWRTEGAWRTEGVELSVFLFSPDGKSLFSSQIKGGRLNSSSRFAQIWDVATHRPTGRPMSSTHRGDYTASADRIVTRGLYGNNALVVRSANDGSILGTGFSTFPTIIDVAIMGMNPDGRTMLASSGNNVILWRISSDAEPIADSETERSESMTGIAFPSQMREVILFKDGLVANGRIAVTAARNAARREAIQLSDPATGRPLGRPAWHNPGWAVRGFALSSDGRSFATGSNPDGRLAGEVRLWDVNTGRLLIPPMPHSNYVATVAFQPDGKVLAAGDYHGLIRFWDTSTGREIGRPLPQGGVVVGLAYSPDGKVLAVGLAPDHSVKPGTRLWDTRTHQSIGGLMPSTGGISRIDFRQDSRVLIASDPTSLRVWDTSRGQALSELIADETLGGFQPDGRAFLTTGRDGTVRLREVASGKVMSSLLASTSPGRCAVFSSDSRLVAAGFEDGSVRLCDPSTSRQIGPARRMKHAVNKVAFTPDGLGIVAIDDLGESRTWPISDPLHFESIDNLTLRIEARTGFHLESGLAIERLDDRNWSDRIEQLRQLDPAALSLDDGPAWHEPMAREAERNGNTFAAIWHLDRLIAAHPDDWFLYARRARASTLSNKFEQAAADYQKAEQLSSRDQVLDFQTHCVVDCTRANRWAEALWYLDRLIAARPDDGSLHEDRAAVYGKLGREADRQAELARVFELGADEGLVIPRAEELGRAGRWAEAAGLLTRCGRRGSVSRELAQAWGVACLKAGDRAAYRDACAAYMAWEGPNPTLVWNALSEASLLALGAEGLDDYQVSIDWFAKRLASNPAPPPMYRHFFSNALGGLLLRAGRIDEAIARLNEGMAAAKEAEGPGDWAYLAIAHARKGSFGEASKWLDRLHRVQHDPRESFWDVQELALLQSEAEMLAFDAAFPSDPFHASTPR